jgi:hypothetical protein
MPSDNDIFRLAGRKMIERIESEIGFPNESSFIQLLEDRSIKSKIKQYLCNVVIPQINSLESRHIIKEIENIASSSKFYDRDLYWSIKDLDLNIHLQYDRAYNKFLAEESGMKYFVYQGNLLTGMNSRDFCREHYDIVFHIDEAKDWAKWTPSKAVNITEFNQKDLDAIPTYLDFPGYDPIIDMGGWNCRHIPSFIPDYHAKELRPDIAVNEPKLSNIIVELNKSLKRRDIKIIERKRIELLSQVDPLVKDIVNQLLNTTANEVIAKNNKLISNGKEITVEQFLNDISPKILKIANTIAEQKKKILNLF